MTRRQPSEPRLSKMATAADARRVAYEYWPDSELAGRYFMATADRLESLEPIAHQPAGTVGIGELMNGG
jgi:hypothetical protein